MDQEQKEVAKPVIVVVASRGYPHPDAARGLFDVYVEDARFVVVDGGATSRALASEAHARGRRVRHLRVERGDDPWEAYQARTAREVILAADVVVVLADKPRARLWSLIGMAGGAGHGVEVYGPDGALWNPPIGPGDLRPGNKPFYIDPNCEYCGTALVLKDADEPEDKRWNDEWICPAKGCGEEYTDWPQWVSRGMIREAEAACAHLHPEGADEQEDDEEEDDDVEPFMEIMSKDGSLRRMTMKEIKAEWRRRDRRRAKVGRELERGNVRAARKALDELMADGDPAQREQEVASWVCRAEGDVAGEIVALKAILEEMFEATGLRRETFRPLRDRLRVLGVLA